MWVWVTPSAEIVALDSFCVGQQVTWWCRPAPSPDVTLPPDVDRADLLIEDSDHSLGDLGDQEFVEVRGQVVGIRAAVDEWRTRLTHSGHSWMTQYEPLPGTRTWHDHTCTDSVRKIPGPGSSGLLVELATSQ